ncbi:unnamed protein product, partial [Rotaria sp. Silwood2]
MENSSNLPDLDLDNRPESNATVPSTSAEDYINDPILEEQWAMKAFQHAETYFNLLCAVDPKQLRLSRHDDKIYSRFRELFPDFKIDVLDENQIKSNEGKQVTKKQQQNESCSLVGGLILLMVESRKEARSLFAGVPTMHNNAPKNYMQLAGRMLLVIMFLTIVRYELSFTSVIQNFIGGICMLFVAVGFKTKLSALFLVVYLTVVNFYMNCFWLVPDHRGLHDVLRYG